MSIYAARKDNALTLMLVNLTDQAITTPLTIDHFAPSGSAQVSLFDAQHKATRQPDLTISGKTDTTIPPASMVLYIIPGTTTGQ